MPTYELAIILRQMARPELVSTLRRTAETILDKGGIIRKINNFGTRELPHKISSQGLVHRTGSYFTVEFDCAPRHIEDMHEEYSRDVDIVRKRIFKQEQPPHKECTLHEELQPPAYRKEVIKMVEDARRNAKPGFKKDFKYNSGLDYYPFQR